jgi:hypothetical protein
MHICPRHMSAGQERRPAPRVAVLLLGSVAELLTGALALWFAKTTSDASGLAQCAIVALYLAPLLGLISLGAAFLRAREVSIAFAWFTVVFVATFSVLIWFLLYGFPCLVLWMGYAVGLHLTGVRGHAHS